MRELFLCRSWASRAYRRALSPNNLCLANLSLVLDPYMASHQPQSLCGHGVRGHLVVFDGNRRKKWRCTTLLDKPTTRLKVRVREWRVRPILTLVRLTGMHPNTSPRWRKADLRDSSRQTPSSRKGDNKAVSAFAFPAPIQLSPLLLIDDDLALASLIAEYCAAGGFSITSALSGEDGLRMARQQFFMLIVLDVMLPGIDGFEVLRRLRQSSKTPILMLTTRGAAMDRVHGLESGADDYLAKPFQPEELVARIKTILRRIYPKDAAAKLSFGDVTVDELERLVLLGDKRIELTGAEFHLLRMLISHPADPMSREELIPCIFGREATANDRSIDNLVNNLRRKLGPYADGTDRIHSVRNIGYCYAIRNDGTSTS